MRVALTKLPAAAASEKHVEQVAKADVAAATGTTDAAKVLRFLPGFYRRRTRETARPDPTRKPR
jgi:hypothetical protein